MTASFQAIADSRVQINPARESSLEDCGSQQSSTSDGILRKISNITNSLIRSNHLFAIKVLEADRCEQSSSRLFQLAYDRLEGLEKISVNQAKIVIRNLESVLNTVVDSQRINGLPSLSICVGQDEISLEWILPDRRIGIVCDDDPIDSSWFIVRRRGQYSSSGRFSTLDVRRLLISFLEDEPL